VDTGTSQNANTKPYNGKSQLNYRNNERKPQMQQALATLIRILALLGHSIETLDVAKNDDGIIVRLEKYMPHKVTVTVTDFWRYPGLPCYFVNYSHCNNGDFAACVGTPHVEQVLFDLGQVVGMIRQ
jgi:hypothetical protein